MNTKYINETCFVSVSFTSMTYQQPMYESDDFLIIPTLPPLNELSECNIPPPPPYTESEQNCFDSKEENAFLALTELSCHVKEKLDEGKRATVHVQSSCEPIRKKRKYVKKTFANGLKAIQYGITLVLVREDGSFEIQTFHDLNMCEYDTFGRLNGKSILDTLNVTDSNNVNVQTLLLHIFDNERNDVKSLFYQSGGKTMIEQKTCIFLESFGIRRGLGRQSKRICNLNELSKTSDFVNCKQSKTVFIFFKKLT